MTFRKEEDNLQTNAAKSFLEQSTKAAKRMGYFYLFASMIKLFLHSLFFLSQSENVKMLELHAYLSSPRVMSIKKKRMAQKKEPKSTVNIKKTAEDVIKVALYRPIFLDDDILLWCLYS
jgi:hypothetical protein